MIDLRVTATRITGFISMLFCAGGALGVIPASVGAMWGIVFFLATLAAMRWEGRPISELAEIPEDLRPALEPEPLDDLVPLHEMRPEFLCSHEKRKELPPELWLRGYPARRLCALNVD